ncbi:hypothetical protein FB451DRAFT_1172566 [Mycena latifolia]|nr:hypothetical protein FB451DRAFT_1172566 [Mycena latifolia]
MSSARLAGSKGKEGKGGVRGIRKVASGSGDDEEIKQGEGSMDGEEPGEGESEHEQRRGLKTATYGSRGKSDNKEKCPIEIQIEGQGTRAIAVSDTRDATVVGNRNGCLFVSRAHPSQYRINPN